MAIMEGTLTRYEWTPSLAAMAKRLRVDEDDMDAFEAAFERARASLAPRAFVKELEIEAMGDDFVMLSGEWFEGARVAGVLAKARRVFAYVATAGETAASETGDALEDWWLRSCADEAVRDAMARLTASIPFEEGEHVSAISPGSLPDWPITEQQPLFRLLGAENAGVALTESCLMLPRASVSGLLFVSPRPFCSCAHCGRGHCPSRKTPQGEE